MSSSKKSKPARKRRPPAFIAQCGFCGDGLLRFWKHGQKLVALCDECELVWDDVPAVAADQSIDATGSFPSEGDQSDWKKATLKEISKAGYNCHIGGRSK